MNEACKQPRPCVDVEWSWTGAERCNGAFVEREYKSNCNRIDWRIDRELSWVDTGVTRCEANRVQRQQRNQCGDLRWNTTATVCGYCADVPLPSGGYAYSNSNARRDPAATEELATATTVVGYIYPTATGNNGMTVPVTVGSGTCDSCATEQIVGYAATTCCDDLCNNQGSTLCAKCD